MNNPEYCQNIYEAAKALTDYYSKNNALTVEFDKLGNHILNLKRALEGKENV